MKSLILAIVLLVGGYSADLHAEYLSSPEGRIHYDLHGPEKGSPVILVHGIADNIVPVENIDFLKRLLVNAPLEVSTPSEMNHIMIWTEYEWVRQLLLEQIGHSEVYNN